MRKYIENNKRDKNGKSSVFPIFIAKSVNLIINYIFFYFQIFYFIKYKYEIFAKIIFLEISI